MSDLIKTIKAKPLFSYVVFNIIYLLIGNYLFHNLIISRFAFSIGLEFVLLPINIYVIFRLRKKYIKNKADIFLIFIGLFSLISCFFAYDKGVALLGVENRYEGLFMIFYYLSLFYVSSYIQKEDRKKIIYLILGIGVYQFLYALCQKFEIMGVTLYEYKGQVYFSGITSNPNYLATIMILCLSYSLGLFIDENIRKKKIIFLSLIIIFTIGLLMSNTLSCVVGLFFVLIYILIYSIKFKKFKKLLAIFISMACVTTTLHFLNATNVVADLGEFTRETATMKTDTSFKYEYNAGTGRIYVWKKALEKVPDHLFTGIGVDNFKYVLDGEPIRRYEYYYDKAHNDYLQTLVNQGIFCLLSYLLFYLIIFIRGIKYSFKKKEILFVLPVIGYLVQIFFNISVINVAPLFYIVLGFCLNRYNEGEKNEA